MAQKDLINLAKGKSAAKPAAKKPTPKKPAAKKPVVKEPTPEEVRDLKAKETVEKLLEDSPIVTLEKKDELLEFDETPTEEPKGVEWLEEQVSLLTEKNEALKAELALAKEDFQKLAFDVQQGRLGSVSNDSEIKTAVLQLFNEIQENHIKLGVNEQGIGNFRIYCPGFLNRLIKFFPFLEQHKRY
jgi:hypothetical protein